MGDADGATLEFARGGLFSRRFRGRQVGAPDVNYPEGVPRNVTSPGGGDGTPWEESLLKDIQGLMQGLLAQVPAGPIVPSGVPDTVLVSQYIDAMKLITQGLDTLTFASAELDTSLRLRQEGW